MKYNRVSKEDVSVDLFWQDGIVDELCRNKILKLSANSRSLEMQFICSTQAVTQLFYLMAQRSTHSVRSWSTSGCFWQLSVQRQIIGFIADTKCVFRENARTDPKFEVLTPVFVIKSLVWWINSFIDLSWGSTCQLSQSGCLHPWFIMRQCEETTCVDRSVSDSQ